MKRLLVFLVFTSLISALSCSDNGGDGPDTPSPPPTSGPPPPPTPEYMDVDGVYLVEIKEIENTCRCEGPRDLPSPTETIFSQNFDYAGNPTGQVWFSGGGLYFGGTNGADTLDTLGNFTVTNLPYNSFTTLNYTGVFHGADGIAEHHETIGPIHLRLDYSTGNCCDGAAGYNIITLGGPKSSDTSAESFPVSFTTEP